MRIDSRTMIIQGEGSTTNLQENEAILKQIFSNCFDFVIRDINIANNPAYKAKVMYLDNMTSKTLRIMYHTLTSSPAQEALSLVI